MYIYTYRGPCDLCAGLISRLDGAVFEHGISIFITILLLL